MADLAKVAAVDTTGKLYGNPKQGVIEEIEARTTPLDQKIATVSQRLTTLEKTPPTGQPAAPAITITDNGDGTATITQP